MTCPVWRDGARDREREGPHAWLIPRKELWPRRATQMFFDLAPATRERESGGRRGRGVFAEEWKQKEKKRSGEYSEVQIKRTRSEERVGGTVGCRGDGDGLAGTRSGSLDTV